MVSFMVDLQTFQLEHGIDGHEVVVVLGGDGTGGQLGRSRIRLNDIWNSSTFSRFW
jgi:hypothetical protein